MISGSGLRASDLGRMVHGLGFGSLGSGFRIFRCSSGLRLWAESLGGLSFRAYRTLRVQVGGSWM